MSLHKLLHIHLPSLAVKIWANAPGGVWRQHDVMLKKAKQQLLMLWEEKEEGEVPKLKWKGFGRCPQQEVLSNCYVYVTALW